MPQQAKGPRLYYRKKREHSDGSPRRGYWVIKDGEHEESTSCGRGDSKGAEEALGEYISRKHVADAAKGTRRAHNVPVADVIALYARDVVPTLSRPSEAKQRARALLQHFGDKVLSDITGAACRAYVAARSTSAAARRELEDLRAAINYHRREGLCQEVISVTLPDRSPGRQRWLTRDEAARLIWAAWRFREKQNFRGTGRRTRQHVARFVLVSLYTGTRAGAVLSTTLFPEPGHAWIDLERGVFYRRGEDVKETKKRQPPISLPDRILAHLRRWKTRLGARYVVEWNRQPVDSVRKAFAAAVKDAGLGPEVTPHVLRHTAVTWAMQNRADLYEAGGYFGLTQEMISRRYGHHHPDHMSSVKEAVTKRTAPRLPPASAEQKMKIGQFLGRKS